MLENLVKVVAEKWKDDPTVASVTIAFLPNKKFYVSICRYLEKFGKGKQVMYKFQHETIEKCIDELTNVMEGLQ